MDKSDVRSSVDEALDQAQEFINKAKTAGAEQAQEFNARAQEALRKAQDQFSDYYEKASVNGREYACKANQYVQDNPWRAVGIAAVAGIVIGALLSRK